MTIQYIYGKNGEKTGVIIPIEEWIEIQKILKKNGIRKKFDPSTYRGVLKDKNIDYQKELREMREE